MNAQRGAWHLGVPPDPFTPSSREQLLRHEHVGAQHQQVPLKDPPHPHIRDSDHAVQSTGGHMAPGMLDTGV